MPAQDRPQTLEICVTGALAPGVTAKDVILAIIGRIGTAGATGTVVEYTGEAIRRMSMEERMTVCNMSIEAGARAGLVAPDEKTFAYLEGRRFAPAGKDFDPAVETWQQLPTDAGAVFDQRVEIAGDELGPQVTWGTNPGMVAEITAVVPDPSSYPDANQQKATAQALEYMGLRPGTPLQEVPVDRVFIGSCTNSRIEDLRVAAGMVKGRRVSDQVWALVVPGSQAVKRAAEEEGLDQIFQAAGFEWRESGCSMCLGMNPDILQPGERCASTSNRNFEGRQGKGGRTHLVSPQMAAAAAVAGHFVDIREWDLRDE